MSDIDQPSGDQPSQPAFDEDAEHHFRPRLRQVQAFPLQAKAPDGSVQNMMGLADARRISDKTVMLPPQAQAILQLMDGSRSVDEIVSQVGHGLTRQALEPLVAQLDGAGLLEGPTFEGLLAKLRGEFDDSSTLPPGSTAQFADALVQEARNGQASEEELAAEAPAALRKQFDAYIDAALKQQEDPALDSLPKAIVAPHLDYPRGWMNYAAVYGRLRVCDRPERVIVLGTNHHGFGTGVVGCDKGFESPLGVCEADQEVVDGLREACGDALFADRFDHEREHSIELHVPWIQHVFSDPDHAAGGPYPKVFGALVHDPTRNDGASYDGQGVGLTEFVEGLKRVLEGLEGTTLIVSSADLSHVGQAFGDQKPLGGDTEEAKGERDRVVQHDRDMLKLVADKKPAELISSMSWMQNPTRWCSIGNLSATLMVTEPDEVQLLNYGLAVDPQGVAGVSSVAAVLR